MKSNSNQSHDVKSLETLLRQLPREKATPGFAARTVLASQKRRPWYVFRPMLATATFAAIGAALALGALNVFKPALSLSKDSQGEQAELEALELLQEMTRELQALQTAPSLQQQPYLRVQGAAHEAYFIDLRSFAEVASETAYAHFKPTRTF